MPKSNHPVKKVQKNISTKEARQQNIFTFKLKKSDTPSKNFEQLFGTLSKHRMKLNTKNAYPKKFDPSQTKKKFVVEGVTIMGDAFTITNKLNILRPDLTKFISEYVESEESISNKFYDIYRSQYIIQEFLYQITVTEPNYYDPNKWYELRFNNQKTLAVPTNNIKFSKQAINEITDHYNARSNFLYNILQFLEVKLAQLKMYEFDKEIKLVSITDKRKESQLLEVWLALREAGFLNHLSKAEQITKQRRLFFDCFNLIDRNFNDNHNQYKRTKTKGDFLKSLSELISVKIEKTKK